MDQLLDVSITKREQRDEQLVQISTTQPLVQESPSSLKSPDDVLAALKAKPSFDLLKKCLQWLDASRRDGERFHVALPSPRLTQIVHVLVNDTVPSYWHALKDSSDSADVEQKKLLLKCLRSIVGIGAFALRLRTLISIRATSRTNQVGHPQQSQDEGAILETLDVLEHVLRGPKTVGRIWSDIQQTEIPVQRTILWKELVGWLSRGKLLSIASEAASINSSMNIDSKDRSWIGDGRQFCGWLGQNIQSMFTNRKDDGGQDQEKAQLLEKAMSLGYNDNLIAACFPGFLHGKIEGIPSNLALLRSLAKYEQRTALLTILRLISGRFSTCPTDFQRTLVKGAAALLQEITKDNRYIQDSISLWFTEEMSTGVELDIGVHRAIFSTMSSRTHALVQALQKLVTQFGDSLYIQKTPILHQEVCLQDILLLVGIVQRAAKEHISSLARSSVYINAISNRLAASSTRSQFLGMVLGMIVSELVDSAEMRMKFTFADSDSKDVEYYRSLVQLDDQIGSVEDLRSTSSKNIPAQKPRPPYESKAKAETSKEKSKIIAIQEVDDGSESDDEDLPVYEKPDSDKEDEDDPTLIERNKPKPPVYIRDLIAGLRDTENYERHRLAITTSANLIRRKTSFGTEVTDHIEEIASQLTNLKDQYDMDSFQLMRLQAMIAIVVAKPLKMGQWFSNTLFGGDYSMSQRASVLTALTMAARELAGYREEDSALSGAHVDNRDLFPSKRLPEKYDKIYRIDSSPVDAISQKLERAMIKPLAAETLDKLTGPDVLKVRTFSSRMEVEKKRKRTINNELAKVVADGFFFPLTGRFRAHLQIHGSQSVFSTPFLRAHFLKSLALILSASGTSTLSLPALTVEFWSLLLHERSAAQGAAPVLEALLFAFLTVLEINANDQRRIAEDHATELLETQAWAERVLENERGGSEEGEKVKMLAAAVLVKAKEVVDKYQRLLMGELVNYM